MQLKDLFREKVGDVSFVDMIEDDNGKFKGCCFVEFKTPEAAQKAVEVLHKHEVMGRALSVKLDTGDLDRRRRPAERNFRDQAMREGGGGGGGPFARDPLPRLQPKYDSYGLNPDFLRSLGIQGPLNNKIFISNLDFKVTERKLEEIFRLAGKLSTIELNTDSDGKSKGHGTAEYEHPLEAVQAISMFNGQRLYARIINVRMDKFSDDGDSMPKLPSGLYGIGKGLGVNGQPMKFKERSSSPGRFDFGIGLGSGNGVSSGGIGSGGLSVLSPGHGGLTTSDLCRLGSSDRLMGSPSLAMSVQSGSLGLDRGSSSMMGRSALDGMGRSSFDVGGTGMRSDVYRDSYESRGGDAFGSSVSDTIIIRNLPSSVNWATLKDRLRDIGQIRFAELKGNDAFVRFVSYQDAQRAIVRFNGIRLDGCTLQVVFY